jgi:hypothetical protein
MTTWFDLWWLLGLPSFFLGIFTAFPSIDVGNVHLFGHALRAWLINHTLLVPLPAVVADRVVHWFLQADALGQWALSLLAAVNLNALLLPLLFALGTAMIRWSEWSARKTIELRRRGAKR